MKASFTIAAEADDTRQVTIQLKQDRFLDRVLGSARVIDAYLSTDADGLVPATGDVYLSPTSGGAGELIPYSVGDESSKYVTDATGKFDVDVVTGTDVAATLYVNVVDPASGKILTSGPIAFAETP